MGLTTLHLEVFRTHTNEATTLAKAKSLTTGATQGERIIHTGHISRGADGLAIKYCILSSTWSYSSIMYTKNAMSIQVPRWYPDHATWYANHEHWAAASVPVSCQFLPDTLRSVQLTVDHLVNRLNHTDHHHRTAKHNDPVRQIRSPTPRRQLDITHRRHDIRHGHRTRRTDQLKYRTKITSQKTNKRSTTNKSRTKQDVTLHREGSVRVKVRLHNLAADKRLQGHGGEHVEAEAQTCDVDHGVVAGEVVEDVAEGFVAEDEEAC